MDHPGGFGRISRGFETLVGLLGCMRIALQIPFYRILVRNFPVVGPPPPPPPRVVA